ncbi:MAG: ABC transporter ATP-binding protein [Brevinematia bacterium]
MLKLEKVSKTFHIGKNRKKVLDSVDLEVNKNEVVAITGKSGEGKTTLLNIIAGIVVPDKGKVFFNGKRVYFLFDLYPAFLRNRYFGFVFQTFRLLPEESVLENLLLPAKIKGFVTKKVKERGLKLLEDFGLIEFKNQKAGLLSGGQKQRLSIARALINNPSLILADEPTANLDKETAKEITDIFKRIVSNGASLLVVTHQDELISLADKRFILRDGGLKEFE